MLYEVITVDGVVSRVKTDDTHPDSPDYPQQRGCARGRSQRMQAFRITSYNVCYTKLLRTMNQVSIL